jgi:hypothetical protein
MMTRLFTGFVVTLAFVNAGCQINSALGLACSTEYQCPGQLVCDPTGHCAQSCPQGRSACDGFCVDTSSDIRNCGTCGKTCPSQACDYWASMDLGFASSDDCVNWVANACMGADGGEAACIAEGNPSNAGQCFQGTCVQTADSSGANCGDAGYFCPVPTADYCAEGDCTAADCSVAGTFICFAGQCNGANLQCTCVQC